MTSTSCDLASQVHTDEPLNNHGEVENAVCSSGNRATGVTEPDWHTDEPLNNQGVQFIVVAIMLQRTEIHCDSATHRWATTQSVSNQEASS